MSAETRAIPLQPTPFPNKLWDMKYIRVLPAELSDLTRGSADGERESAENPPFTPHSVSADFHADPLTSRQIRATDDKVRAQERAQPRVCQQCGGSLAGKKNRPRFCSPECYVIWRTGRPAPGFITPESDRPMRIRAQGLINRRLALGWFTKPATCCWCGNPHRRITAHHADYSKPDHVHWVCPGCHNLIHYTPSLLNGIPPFVCYDRRTADQKPKPHGKGGWTGERDQEYKNARCGVSMDQARAIRARYKRGDRQVDIAKWAGISQMSVSRIVRMVRQVPIDKRKAGAA